MRVFLRPPLIYISYMIQKVSAVRSREYLPLRVLELLESCENWNTSGDHQWQIPATDNAVSLLKPKIEFWYSYTAGLIKSVPFLNPQLIHFMHKFYFYKSRKLQIPSFKYCARRMMRISKWSWRVSRFGLLLLLLPERRTAGRIGTSGTLWDTSLGYILWCCVIKL